MEATSHQHTRRRRTGRYSSATSVLSAAPTIPAARTLDLGRRPFAEVWQLQLDLVAARQRDEIPDTLLLVEHPEVITLGRSAKQENLLAGAAGMATFAIERGGDVTYHGPGQLVAYPIVHLQPGERDLHRYLRNLEETVILAAAQLGLQTGRRDGLTGVWTCTQPPEKLASIGIAVKRWVTLHGFALNVATDLSRFAAINPCGMDALVMASLSSALGRTVSLDEVKPLVARALGQVLGRDFKAGP